jgi:DNA repair protein REV1
MSLIMPTTLAPTPSASLTSENEYFNDSPAFLQALQDIVLPGDSQTPRASPTHDENRTKSVYESTKRPHSPSSSPATPQQHDDDQNNGASTSYTDNADIYGPSRFGEFGEYMRRKRAKLQIQNTQFDSEGNSDADDKSRIFRGLAIYVSHAPA